MCSPRKIDWKPSGDYRKVQDTATAGSVSGGKETTNEAESKSSFFFGTSEVPIRNNSGDHSDHGHQGKSGGGNDETVARVIEHLKTSFQGSSSSSEAVAGEVGGKYSLDSAAKLLGMDEKEVRSCCKAIAERAKGKSVDELREMFGIVNDFNPEEEDVNRMETVLWAFSDD